MKKKVLFALMLGLFAFANLNAADLWTSYRSTTWYYGHEEDKEFTLSSEEELAGLAYLVYKEKITFEGKTIQLAEDFNPDLSAHDWVPIGWDQTTPFMGSFDGQGNSISGLKVGVGLTNMNISRGLFGFVQVPNGKTISFIDITLSAENGAGISGSDRVMAYSAALIGNAYRNDNAIDCLLTLTNCHNEIPVSETGTMEFSNIGGLVGFAWTETTVENCTNSGAISTKHISATAGGIIGCSVYSTTLSNCANYGSITATGSDDAEAGGLIGITNGALTINHCLNSGAVTVSGPSNLTRAGGLAGRCVGTLTLSASYSAATITSATGGTIGGLVGAALYSESNISISDCFAAGSVLVEENQGIAGGIIGEFHTTVNATVSLSNNIVILSKLKGGTVNRIAGKITENTNTLPKSYAYLLNDMVYTDKSQGVPGDDWTGYMNKAPISNWKSSNDWTIDKSNRLLPKLTALKNVDVVNPLSRMITFDLNGGTPAVATKIIVSDLPVSEPTVPTRNIDRFEGWHSKKGSDYIPWNFETAITQDTTIYALWTKRCILTIDRQDGNSPAKTIYDAGYKINDPGILTRAGYRFLGWFSQPEGGAKWDFSNLQISRDITLYAQWVKLWTLSFDSRGGSGLPVQIIDEGTTAMKPADPTRNGYAFLGWASSIDATTPDWEFTTPINQDITLYALWQPLLSADFITVDPIATQIYSGKPLMPTVTVRYGKELLVLDVDYSVSYKDNIEVGTGEATITGKGSYGGTVKVYFPILAPTPVVALTIEEVENATTIPAAGTSWYQAGLKPEIRIIPDEGFSTFYIYVYLNGVQIYPNPLRGAEVREEGGELILRLDQLTENAHLRIEGISPVAINEAAGDFHLSLQPNGIRVDAARASTIQVVGIHGAMASLRVLPVGSTFIGLAPGSYIVRIEGNSWKVMVK
ncbi:InlB B-repeat-containing protein [Parabacteroides sp. OttesenSCG-928-N08]|nr:InlB B-repeat-containing protein [Parabacteroides sp. OttesenSCG-928-N08]